MWNTSKIRCLTSSPPLGPQCQPPKILFKIGPKVHMRIISINSMRKSKKIPGRRLSIVPSSCAWVSCWFWIVMLHRSRGVLAKNGKIQAERDPSFNRKLPKIRFATSFQIFADSWPFLTFGFNFDREKPIPARLSSLLDFSTLAQNFCHVLLLLFGYFCCWHFCLDFHLWLFRRNKLEDLVLLWRIHCSGRAWLGTSWGSNGKWYDFSLYIRGISAENSNRPKMVEIQDLYKLISTSLIRQALIFLSPLVNLRRGEISWLMKKCICYAVLFVSNKVQIVPNFFRKHTSKCYEGFWSDELPMFDVACLYHWRS